MTYSQADRTSGHIGPTRCGFRTAQFGVSCSAFKPGPEDAGTAPASSGPGLKAIAQNPELRYAKPAARRADMARRTICLGISQPSSRWWVLPVCLPVCLLRGQPIRCKVFFCLTTCKVFLADMDMATPWRVVFNTVPFHQFSIWHLATRWL